MLPVHAQFLTGRPNALRRTRPKVSKKDAAASAAAAEEAEEAAILQLRFVRDGTGDVLFQPDAAPWTRRDLRRALQRMLIAHRLAPDRLLAAWDRDKRGEVRPCEALPSSSTEAARGPSPHGCVVC